MFARTRSTLMRPKSTNGLPKARRLFFWCIMRAWGAKWTPSCRSRGGMGLQWSRTTRMASMENIALGTSAPSDLLAAFLRAQLEHRDQIQSKRRQIWQTYARELASWAEANGVLLPIIPPECEQTYHMFYMIMPSFESRQALIAHLAGFGILAVFHYLPLHLSSMGLRFGGRQDDCPVTEDLADRLLRLPFFTGMSSSEQSQVIDAVRGFHC